MLAPLHCSQFIILLYSINFKWHSFDIILWGLSFTEGGFSTILGPSFILGRTDRSNFHSQVGYAFPKLRIAFFFWLTWFIVLWYLWVPSLKQFAGNIMSPKSHKLLQSWYEFLGGCCESLNPCQWSRVKHILNHHMNFAGGTNWCTGTSQFLQNDLNYLTIGAAVNMYFNTAKWKVLFLERT